MPNKEKLIYDLYHNQKLPSGTVAKIVGCSKSVVLNTLYRTGIPRTRKEGVRYRATPEYREKIRQTQLGENNHQVKLTEQQVIDIRKEYEFALQNGQQKTATQRYLARKYGVKRPTISDVVLRKTWKHI